MIIELPDNIIQDTLLTEQELRLAIAIWLFVEKNWSLGRSAKVANLHKIQFQRELAKRKIPVHYTEEDLDRDLGYRQFGFAKGLITYVAPDFDETQEGFE